MAFKKKKLYKPPAFCLSQQELHKAPGEAWPCIPKGLSRGCTLYIVFSPVFPISWNNTFPFSSWGFAVFHACHGNERPGKDLLHSSPDPGSVGIIPYLFNWFIEALNAAFHALICSWGKDQYGCVTIDDIFNFWCIPKWLQVHFSRAEQLVYCWFNLVTYNESFSKIFRSYKHRIVAKNWLTEQLLPVPWIFILGSINTNSV